MAFGGDFTDPEGLARRDTAAIEALGRALVGSGKPFVSTSSTLVMKAGQISRKIDAPEAGSLLRSDVGGGLTGRLVHSPDERHQTVAYFLAVFLIASQTGPEKCLLREQADDDDPDQR